MPGSRSSSTRPAFAALICALFVACSPPSPASNPPQSPGNKDRTPSSGQQADWAKVLKLEDEAKAIVRTEGCSSAEECKSAGVGSRGCGGPRYYLVYCARTTDTTALRNKLDEVVTAERAYNARYNIASTCEFRTPPPTTLSGGACTEQLRR